MTHHAFSDAPAFHALAYDFDHPGPLVPDNERVSLLSLQNEGTRARDERCICAAEADVGDPHHHFIG